MQIEKKQFFKSLNIKGQDKYNRYQKIVCGLIDKQGIIKIENDIKKSMGVVLLL